MGLTRPGHTHSSALWTVTKAARQPGHRVPGNVSWDLMPGDQIGLGEWCFPKSQGKPEWVSGGECAGRYCVVRLHFALFCFVMVYLGQSLDV